MDKARDMSQGSSINFPELLSRVDNDSELLLDLFAIFKDDIPRHLQALQDAVSREDMKQIATISHTLKGMLSNLAVTRGCQGRRAVGEFGALGREHLRTENSRCIRNRSAGTIAGDGGLYDRGVALKILIADDEAISRRLLEKTLERAGYEVVAVENGRLAV